MEELKGWCTNNARSVYADIPFWVECGEEKFRMGYRYDNWELLS